MMFKNSKMFQTVTKKGSIQKTADNIKIDSSIGTCPTVIKKSFFNFQ